MLGGYLLGTTGVSEDHALVDVEDVKLLSLMKLDNSAVASYLSGYKTDSVKRRRRAGDFLIKIVNRRLVPTGVETQDVGYESEAIRQGLLPKSNDDDGEKVENR